MCVNYGGRAELADAARSIARDVAAGRLNPDKVDERAFARYLYVPEHARRRPVPAHVGGAAALELPALAVGVRRAGLPDVLWPDVDRRDLWAAIETYARRDRRYGGARP